MSTPIRPPLAQRRCIGCGNEAKGRAKYCAKCRHDRHNASRRERQRRQRAGSTVPERLDRIEAMLAQLIALGGRAA